MMGWLMGPNVQVWSVHMHFNVKGFKIIRLHSNFQTFLQHSTNKIKLDVNRFVLNMKIIRYLTILNKYMQYIDALKLSRFPT